MATFRSWRRSRARKTVAMPPSPSSRSTSYRSASAALSLSRSSVTTEFHSAKCRYDTIECKGPPDELAALFVDLPVGLPAWRELESKHPVLVGTLEGVRVVHFNHRVTEQVGPRAHACAENRNPLRGCSGKFERRRIRSRP